MSKERTVSEPPLTAVVVPQPMTAKALALRRPELMFDRGAEYAEEGDLLFPIQQAETDNGKLWGPSPNLCYPTAVEVAFVGEVFRAGIIFRNAASYALQKLVVRVNLMSPSNHRTNIFEGLKANEVPAFGHHDMKIMCRLTEPGNYRLNIHAHVTDVTGEKRVLQLNFTIPVQRAFEDVETTVTLVQRPSSNSQLEGTDGVISSQHALLSFGLRNQSTEPLTLTDVRFVPKDGNTALYVTPVPRKALLGNGGPEPAFKHRYTGGGKDPLNELHTRPGDTRNYLFELVPKPQSVQTGPAGRGQSVSQAVNVAKAMRDNNTAELGTLLWEWRRANGDGGRDQSGMVATSRPPPIVELDLEASITPCAASSSAVAGDIKETASSPSRLLHRYEACTVQFRVSNRCQTKRRDLSLVVKPNLLLDHSWIYTGACSRLMGIAEPGGELIISFTLMPMLSGPLALPSSAFQIRDANDSILWPPNEVTTQSGGSRIDSNVSSVLCEVNVV